MILVPLCFSWEQGRFCLGRSLGQNLPQSTILKQKLKIVPQSQGQESPNDSQDSNIIEKNIKKRQSSPLQDGFETLGSPNELATHSQNWESQGGKTTQTQELVGRLLGVYTSPVGAGNLVPRVSLRGSAGLAVAFFWEDFNLSSQYAGESAWDMLPLTLLEEVQVLPSGDPYSLGATGVGGVVKFKYCKEHCPTLFPKGTHFRVGTEAGSFRYRASQMEGRVPLAIPHEGRPGTNSNDLTPHLLWGVGTRQAAQDFSFTSDGGTPSDPSDDYKAKRRNNQYAHQSGLLHLHFPLTGGPFKKASQSVIWAKESRGIPYSVLSQRQDEMHRELVGARTEAVAFWPGMGLVFKPVVGFLGAGSAFDTDSQGMEPTHTTSQQWQGHLSLEKAFVTEDLWQGQWGLKAGLTREQIRQSTSVLNSQKQRENIEIQSHPLASFFRLDVPLADSGEGNELAPHLGRVLLRWQQTGQDQTWRRKGSCPSGRDCQGPGNLSQYFRVRSGDVSTELHWKKALLYVQWSSLKRIPYAREVFGTSGAVLPQLSLRSESSQVWEAGVQAPWLSWSVFGIRDQNRIESVVVSPVRTQSQNRGPGRRWGHVVRWELPLGLGLTPLVQYEYLKAWIQRTPGSAWVPQPFAPVHRGLVQWRWDPSQVPGNPFSFLNVPSWSSLWTLGAQWQSEVTNGGLAQERVAQKPTWELGWQTVGKMGDVVQQEWQILGQNLTHEQEAKVSDSLGRTRRAVTTGYRSFPPSGRAWKIQTRWSF